MKAFISGSLGFIGSALTDRLITAGWQVVGFDNGSTGFQQYRNPKAEYVVGDVRDETAITSAMNGCDTVFHLSANADIKSNWDNPANALRQNTLATSNILESMRVLGIRRIAFASSSAVYGEHSQLPTPEDCTWPIQTSLYGASKVAGEALVAAYCAGQKFEGYIFRFSPVVGERYTHGHIFDFVRALLDNPNRLVVRGNGKQRKPYVYVGDVVQAMTWIMGHHWDAYPAIYNVTNVDAVAVSQNVEWIASEMGLKPTVHYGTEDKGWTGDMPVLWPSSEKLRRTGWAPLVSTEEGVRRTVRWLLSNRWALEGRE